jgi:hypothetical protein
MTPSLSLPLPPSPSLSISISISLYLSPSLSLSTPWLMGIVSVLEVYLRAPVNIPNITDPLVRQHAKPI